MRGLIVAAWLAAVACDGAPTPESTCSHICTCAAAFPAQRRQCQATCEAQVVAATADCLDCLDGATCTTLTTCDAICTQGNPP